MDALLKAGLQRMGLQPEQHPRSAYLAYIELLIKWNRAYNLTAIKDPEEILKRHVLDSLSVLFFIKGEYCLDVGTGPGLPGMILALAQPEKCWTLLDSNQKKVRFLRHAKAELDVPNVEIVQARVEDYVPDKTFDTIICRAFAPLTRILELTSHLITGSNQLLAMKGKLAETEISELEEHNFLIEVENLSFVDDSSNSNLVKIRRKTQAL